MKVDKEGGVGMEDAAGFFAHVFGGERFRDWVCVFTKLFQTGYFIAPSDRRDLTYERDDKCCNYDHVGGRKGRDGVNYE
jgi:hypothetical protein